MTTATPTTATAARVCAPAVPELVPLHRVSDFIPSSHRGKRLALATVYRWAAKGHLRTVKVGGGRYVSKDELARVMHAGRSAGTPWLSPATAAKQASGELDRLLGTRTRRGRLAPLDDATTPCRRH